jgi:hypothetical protein
VRHPPSQSAVNHAYDNDNRLAQITQGRSTVSCVRGVHLFYGLALSLVPVIYLAAHFFKYVIPPGVEPYVPDLSLRLRR